jgi:ribose 5-phosphate isomerase B
MRIAIGSDHAGFALKQHLLKILNERGDDVTDFGTHDAQSVDYPDYGKHVARGVANGEFDLGVAICSTGVGISIVCNKVKRVRAALCTDPFVARRTREHNNANVLCLGGGIVGPDLAADILVTFLDTPFSGAERHQRRIDKITSLEGS